ncbi:hypothetical protein [Moritella yayanosii]|uniref:Uncharacterized protein n=1 Tax=Moritella yayanosii TaxID=69539 RepID=A0A330LU25_9GAMM|nr:protein of unknown function, might be fragment of Transposase [Moritella yayanosii]
MTIIEIGPLVCSALLMALGDGYLRKLLVHGARAAFRHVKDKTDPLSLWIKNLSEKNTQMLLSLHLLTN